MTRPLPGAASHRVLLVEDDPGDVFLVQELLAEVDPSVRVTVAESVRAVVERNLLPGADCVLLDLNLPKRDGREVLEEIKKDDELGRIPVVVLTTSSADEDILRSYQLHANAYVTKPVDFDRFIAVIKQIDEFFVSVVKLPPRA